MIITIEHLKEAGGDTWDMEWLNKNYPNGFDTNSDIDSLTQKNDFYMWSISYLRYALSREGNVKLMLYATELLLPVFLQKYPSDNSIEKALCSIKEWIQNKSADTDSAKNEILKSVNQYRELYDRRTMASLRAENCRYYDFASLASERANYWSGALQYCHSIFLAISATTSNSYKDLVCQSVYGLHDLRKDVNLDIEIIKYGFELLQEQDKECRK